MSALAQLARSATRRGGVEMGGRSRRRRLRLVGAIAGLLVLGATSACGGASWQPPGAAGGSPTLPPAVFTFGYAADAKEISPTDPVTVSVAGGTLDTVTLTNPEGKQVQGELDATKTSWKSTEKLGYDKTYTLAVVGTSEHGERAEESRSFSTVKPANYTLPYLRANSSILLDKGTFGVAQPIVLWFDEPIKDKATVERSLTVTTQPPTE